MVVIKPLRIPKFSSNTLATGARQLVVQDAFEMTWCWRGSYLFESTPRTIVMSGPECVKDDLSSAGGEVLFRHFPDPEQAGAFRNDIHTEFPPTQHGRIFDPCNRYRFVIDFDGVVFSDNCAVKRTVD